MISRAQMNRQLYYGGGIPSIYYNVPRYARGGIVEYADRKGFLFGGIGKAISGAVKGVTSAVKNIVSSDIGKLALAAAGTYYLGGGNLFGLQRAGLSGFSFGNIPGVLQAKQFLMGTPAYDFGGRSGGILNSLISGGSNLLSGKNLLTAGIGVAGGVLPSLFGGKEQAMEAFKRDPAAVKSYLAQYYKNTNKNASEEEVNQFVESQTREYAADGGRIGFAFGAMPMGEPRENQGGIMELDYRDTGGFVPVGIKEKADDVPAMLSKNEFVFTADAVKGADPEGEGDVERGAQALYNTMKTLENGGMV